VDVLRGREELRFCGRVKDVRDGKDGRIGFRLLRVVELRAASCFQAARGHARGREGNMKHFRIAILCVAAISAAALLSCGGSARPASTPVAATPPPPPQPPPPPPVVDPKERLDNLLESGDIDSLLISDGVGELELEGSSIGNMRFLVTCAGGSCEATTTVVTSPFLPTEETEVGETLSASDFDLGGLFGDEISLSDLEVRNLHDIHFTHIETSEETGFTGETLGAGGEFWGGWLEYQVFGAALAAGTDPVSGLGLKLGMAISLGDAAGSIPDTGIATWNGAMAGVDTEEWAAVEGHASIRISNFPNPEVDARFTQIAEVDGGSPRQDMSWLGIPVTQEGFKTGISGDSIQGTFYGPGHEEVGGVFEKSSIVGAFGAKRP